VNNATSGGSRFLSWTAITNAWSSAAAGDGL
jgi:hypothetical protein